MLNSFSISSAQRKDQLMTSGIVNRSKLIWNAFSKWQLYFFISLGSYRTERISKTFIFVVQLKSFERISPLGKQNNLFEDIF